MAGVSLAMLLSLGGQAQWSPFEVRTALPKLAKGEYYSIVGDGYAVRRKLHDDVVTIVDLYSGQTRWRVDPGVGYVADFDLVDDVLVVTGRAYSDEDKRSTRVDQSTTVAYDIASGAELWRRPLTYLGHGVGTVVPLWCNGCEDDAIGVDARTGAEIWRSPELRSANMFDGGRQWAVDRRTGVLRSIDLLTGEAREHGTLPAKSWIVGWNDRFLLVEPPLTFPDSTGPVSALPSTVTLYDRVTLTAVSSFPVKSPGSIPPELQVCGAFMCRRGGVELEIVDQRTGKQIFKRAQFLLGAVVDRPDGQTLVFGEQSRSGVVVPGIPMDTNQFLDPASGSVLADVGAWRLMRVDHDRLWVGLFASRGVAKVIYSPNVPANQAYLGYIDLRPGAPLEVTVVAPLGGTFEDCDLRGTWLICTDKFNGSGPVALKLQALATPPAAVRLRSRPRRRGAAGARGGSRPPR